MKEEDYYLKLMLEEKQLEQELLKLSESLSQAFLDVGEGQGCVIGPGPGHTSPVSKIGKGDNARILSIAD